MVEEKNYIYIMTNPAMPGLVDELSFEDNQFCFQYEVLGNGKVTGLGKSKKAAKRDACNNLISEYLIGHK